MKKTMLFLASFFLFASLNIAQEKEVSGNNSDTVKAKVTFVELGSVKCIPCKQMQPVMKAIEEKYGKQVEVIFHDVWTDEGKQYSEKYGVKLIPTQVFLDENGKEFYRHEGFYPEKEIDKILQSKGLTPKNTEG